MTGLFFAVDPVWWIGTIHLSSIWISIIAGLIVGLGFWYRYHRQGMIQIPQREPYIYHPVDPSVTNYASLTLMEIRRYLGYTYQPRHSWAHIPSQIAEYTTDMSLIEIVGQLEQSEYAQKELTQEEKETINRVLSMKMKNKN